MKCKECEHFHIVMQPLRSGGTLYDFGRAECRKHNMIVDFSSNRKINKLECVEENKEERNE